MSNTSDIIKFREDLSQEDYNAFRDAWLESVESNHNELVFSPKR